MYLLMVNHSYWYSVDDILLTRSKRLKEMCKENLALKFGMDIGMMHYFLGLKVMQQPGEILFESGKYVINMLKRFKMEDHRSMLTPMITKLRKLNAIESELVNPTLYRQGP